MMPVVSFGGLLVVAAVAFAAPLALGFFPRFRLPSPVLEIALGIAIGPAGLGWVTLDEPIRILALVGLAFLLFLGGLEIEVERLRGRLLGLAGLGLVASLSIALATSLVFKAAGLVESPLLVAVILTSTGLGVLIPILKDAGQTRTELGQLVIVWASLADFGAIILLALLFSRDASGPGSRAVLLVGFALVCAAVGFGIARGGRSARVTATIERLQDTTAQIRVRGSMVLLIGLAAVAESLGLETILGAFLAGAILSAIDRDRMMTHPHFRVKLEAMGFGLFVPVFFVASGLTFDLHALTSSPSALARVPLFAAALLLVHVVPVVALAGRSLGTRRALGAGLYEATTLSFVVAAVQIGASLGLVGPATGAALVAAGLLSVLIFPLVAGGLLGESGVPLVETAP